MDPISRFSSIDPGARTLSLLDEFKKFAFKGNVIDLAVGVIIGGAFGKIVDSLVKSLIMPLIGVVVPGKEGYADWSWTLRGQTIPYGQFLAEVINFLIVAAALFLFIVKFLGWVIQSKKPESKPIPPSTQEVLLTEIPRPSARRTRRRLLRREPESTSPRRFRRPPKVVAGVGQRGHAHREVRPGDRRTRQASPSRRGGRGTPATRSSRRSCPAQTAADDPEPASTPLAPR